MASDRTDYLHGGVADKCVYLNKTHVIGLDELGAMLKLLEKVKVRF